MDTTEAKARVTLAIRLLDQISAEIRPVREWSKEVQKMYSALEGSDSEMVHRYAELFEELYEVMGAFHGVRRKMREILALVEGGT